jgi:hypothetical protein
MIQIIGYTTGLIRWGKKTLGFVRWLRITSGCGKCLERSGRTTFSPKQKQRNTPLSALCGLKILMKDNLLIKTEAKFVLANLQLTFADEHDIIYKSILDLVRCEHDNQL